MSTDNPIKAVLYVEPRDMKSLGEALSVAEGMLLRNNQYRGRARHISNLLKQMGEHRPVGTDGKHGDRHTPTCGCEDKE